MSQCPQGSCGCTAAPGEAGHPGQSHCLGPKKAEAAEEILGPMAAQGPRTCWSFLGRPPLPQAEQGTEVRGLPDPRRLLDIQQGPLHGPAYQPQGSTLLKPHCWGLWGPELPRLGGACPTLLSAWAAPRDSTCYAPVSGDQPAVPSFSPPARLDEPQNGGSDRVHLRSPLTSWPRPTAVVE